MNLHYPHFLQIQYNLIFHNLLYLLYLEKINYYMNNIYPNLSIIHP